MRRGGHVGLVAGLLAVGLTVAANALTPDAVRREGDRLSVHVTDAPAGELIDAIAAVLGAQVRGTPRADAPLTAAFDRLPIPLALTRLFGDSFTIVYDRAGAVRTIRFLAGRAERLAPAPVRAAIEAPTTPGRPTLNTSPESLAIQAKLQRIAEAALAHPAIGITGRLSSALGGKSSATLWNLLQMGSAAPDPTLRVDALRLLANAIETDEHLRRTTLTELKDISDGALVGIAHGFFGTRAPDVLGNFVSVVKDPRLRARTSAIRFHLMQALAERRAAATP